MRYIRTDVNPSAQLIRVWYRDRYGQPRFFEFSVKMADDDKDQGIIDIEQFGEELIAQLSKEPIHA